ncbi:MAG: metallophosphoesterase [Gammaproteobacteria bacterium]|nr:metallophosphoesterase [Gammaproteobacteria bacterium]
MDLSKLKTTLTALIFITLLSSLNNVAHALALSRAPYLQMATPNSITVRWRTDQLSLGEVSYGLTANNLNLTASASNALALDHEVSLTNLSANSRYYYSVGENGTPLASAAGSVHHFDTPPNNGSSKSSRIWVLGDSGVNDGGARAVRDSFYAKEISDNQQANLILLLGDNAYANRRLGSSDGSDAAYQDALFSKYESILSRASLWPSMGNHDVRNGNISVYRDIFSLPSDSSGTELYYSFDYANVHFICLDSMESNRDTTGLMYSWLESDLATSSADWIVAYWHHPPYSKGSHNSDDRSREGKLVQMRENFLPLLESYGVDLVLSGHSHSYERSYLIDQHYGDSSTFNRTTQLKDGGDGKPLSNGAYLKAAGANQGAVYVVSGSSSQIDADAETAFMNGDVHPVMYRSKIEYGSVILDVNANQMNVQFLNKDHQVSDHFRIQKGLDSTPPELLFAQVINANTVQLSLSETPLSVSLSQFVISDGVSVNAVNFNNSSITLTTSTLPSNLPLTLTVAGLSDSAGNVMLASSQSLIFAQSQNTPPPSLNLQAEVNAANEISLRWQPLNDPNAFLYRITRNDQHLINILASDLSSSYQDSALLANTEYRYQLIVLDGNGTVLGSENTSVSTADAVSTGTGTAPPSSTAPTTTTVTTTSGGGGLSFYGVLLFGLVRLKKKSSVLLCLACLASSPVWSHADIQRSLNIINEQIQQQPKNAQLYLQRAELHHQHQNWSLALKDYTIVQQLDANSAQLPLLRGNTHLHAGHYSQAKADLDQAIQRQPKNATAYLYRARTFRALKQTDAALHDFDQALKQQPKRAAWHLERAELLIQTGKGKQALKGLERAMSEVGALVGFIKRGVDVAQRQKKYKQAIGYLDKLPKALYQSPLWMLKRGKLLQQDQQVEAAQQTYQKALDSINALPPFRQQVRAVQELKQQIMKALTDITH